MCKYLTKKFKYCTNIVQILCKYLANIAKILCKYCTHIVQVEALGKTLQIQVKSSKSENSYNC